MTFPKDLDYNFYSSPESLGLLESIFEYLLNGIELDEENYKNIKLCFFESVTNAIKHGNQFDATKMVALKRIYKPPFLIFYIKDEGKGFEIEKVENPLQENNIEKPCGRGVFFLKHFCKSTVYCNEKKVLKLEFEL